MVERLIEVVDQEGRVAHLILTSAVANDVAKHAYIVTVHGLDGIPLANAAFPVAAGASIEQAERRAEEWAEENGWRRK